MGKTTASPSRKGELLIAQGIAIPGIAIPGLIAVVIGVFMTFIITHTRFSHYVFAIGANLEVAGLAGINISWVAMKIFMVICLLTAVYAAISLAYQNASTNIMDSLDKPLVIALAIIGSTSCIGGSDTIVDAMLGALLIQLLQLGMVLLILDTPPQKILVGLTLGRDRQVRHTLLTQVRITKSRTKLIE